MHKCEMKDNVCFFKMFLWIVHHFEFHLFNFINGAASWRSQMVAEKVSEQTELG